MGRMFTCYMCNKTEESEWSDAEAEAEMKRNFGEDIDKSDCDIVCDDCYNKLMGNEQPGPSKG